MYMLNIFREDFCVFLYYYYYYTTTVLRPSGFCPELSGWAGTRKVKPIWIYCSKR